MKKIIQFFLLLMLITVESNFAAFRLVPSKLGNIQNIIRQSRIVVANLFNMMKKSEHQNYIGENVSQLNHALQAAVKMMELQKVAINSLEHNTKKSAIVYAALFHDVGHLVPSNNADMDGYGVYDHEQVGRDYLKKCGFPLDVTEPVLLHAMAKRYLATKSNRYYDTLSEASKKTMLFQGGKMTPEEMKEFENNSYFKAAIQLRLCDDYAKDPHAQLPFTLDQFKKLLERYLVQVALQKEQEQLTVRQSMANEYK